jgi:lysophospholipase L1-like esterase
MRLDRVFASFLMFSAASLASGTAIAARRVTVVAIGDSTTAGTPFFASPLESPPEGTGDPEGQYIHWMQKKQPDWHLVNLGYRGQRSGEIRGRFDAALEFRPRYIIILAGVNDVFQNYPLKQTGENLFAMYQKAKSEAVIPIAATLPPFDRATPEQAKELHLLNDWIRRTADKLLIPIVDFNAILKDPANPDRLNGSPDGLHPDIGGYRQMGIAAARVIADMEKNLP